jgi:hypothetical protein
MDEDLKQHLDAMEGRLVNLMTGVKESLKRELEPLRDALHRIEARQMLFEFDMRIEDLTQRVEELEKRTGAK